MPNIKELRIYPVAGLEGYAVDELVVTPEAIIGNRSFAIVLESEVELMLHDPEYIPRRLTQVKAQDDEGVRRTSLTRLQAVNENGLLLIINLDTNERFVTIHTITVEESLKPFYENQKMSSLPELLERYALPFRVSTKSQSQRWAVDCGDEAADWLSNIQGERVRLVKAVFHPETHNHHFSWFTQLHAVMSSSLVTLAQESGDEVDPLTFRYNLLIDDSESFEEENWNNAMIDGVKALVTACQRCGYIGIDRTTGILAQHMKVLTAIMQKHNKNFGVYFQPQGDSFRIRLKIGDTIDITS